MRSLEWTKPVPNRPLTQRVPKLDWFAGASSAIPASLPSSLTLSVMPQPTPQYGHVVSTSRVIGAGVSFGLSAPVGQVATHWPQEVQTEDDIGPSPATPTRMSWPRPISEMAPISWTSSQAVVQRPQRMQASRSRTKKDLVASTSNRCSGAHAGSSSPCRAPAWLSCPKPTRSSDSVSIERVRLSTAVARAEHGAREIEHRTPGLDGVRMRGLDDHAVARRQVARGGQATLPLDVDEAGAACAERSAVGILAELGQLDVEPVDGVQHRRSRRHLDPTPVYRQLHGGYLSSAGNSCSADRMDSGAAWPNPQSEATRTTSDSSATAE